MSELRRTHDNSCHKGTNQHWQAIIVWPPGWRIQQTNNTTFRKVREWTSQTHGNWHHSECPTCILWKPCRLLSVFLWKTSGCCIFMDYVTSSPGASQTLHNIMLAICWPGRGRNFNRVTQTEGETHEFNVTIPPHNRTSNHIHTSTTISCVLEIYNKDKNV